MNIFVAKLSFKTTSEVLHEVFSQFGEVTSAKVIMDRETHRSKGFGFVEMPNDEEAKKAIATLNNAELQENIIVVKEAEPRETYQGGGGGGGRREFRPRGGGNRGGFGGGNRGGGGGGRRGPGSFGDRNDRPERTDRWE